VEAPLGEDERTIANHLPRARPLVAVGLEALAVERRVGGEGRQFQEVGHRVLEPDLEGVVIQGPEPEFLRVGEFALVEGAGVLDWVEHVGIFRRRLGLERPSPGVDEVARSERLAIAPTGLPQMEAIGAAVGGYLPALGHPGHRGEGLRMERSEALEERERDGVFGQAGHQRGVERLGLDPVVEDQDLSVAEAGPRDDGQRLVTGQARDSVGRQRRRGAPAPGQQERRPSCQDDEDRERHGARDHALSLSTVHCSRTYRMIARWGLRSKASRGTSGSVMPQGKCHP